MQTITKLLAISFSLSLLLSAIISCEAEDNNPSGEPKPGYLDQMPEETSIGANTFGCYINGELAAVQGWYQKEGIQPNAYGMGMGLVDGFLWKGESNYLMDIWINLKSAFFFIKIREYPNLGKNKCYFSIDKRESDISFGGSDAVLDIIRFDTVEHIISGRFDDIKVASIPNNLNIKDTLYITNGQFDIKYGQNF